MESAIRWSHSQNNEQRFLVADIAGNRLQYCKVDGLEGEEVKYSVITQREKLPNYTAFEWFRQNESLVAIGTSAGACRIVSIDDGSDVHEFPVKVQRKCNSVAFSANNLVAVGLDRTRGDSSLNIHDLGHQAGQKTPEPYRRLGGAEIITNVKFFADQPNTLVAGSAGVARAGSQSLKLFDLRDHAGPTMVTTKHVYLLSVDPLDENYFVSAGAATENAVSVWDKRWLTMSSTVSSPQPNTSMTALDIRPILDPIIRPEIWSVRYSGYKRGEFAAMSSTGVVRVIETGRLHDTDHASTLLYTRKSDDLSSKTEREGIPSAFDFAQITNTGSSTCLITVRTDKRLGFIEIPGDPPKAEISAQGDILSSFLERTAAATHHRPVKTVAEELESFRWAHDNHPDSAKGQSWLPSYERHKQHTATCRDHMSTHNLALVGDVARRRCREGYLFDCQKNQEITRDDPWLVGLWILIERFERMAKHGMAHKGLDFSYFGVHDLWFANFDGSAERVIRRSAPSREEFSALVSELLRSRQYPVFDGAKTRYPGLRQMGLSICGYRFDERRLREKCSDIISRKEYYKAIVVAVYHGRKDIAIELLKALIRSKALNDSGLAAVIVCPTISNEQREMCQWMAEEAEDPYLRALLAYFVSGTWRTVAEMSELPLIYRVAVALKNFADEELDAFLDSETAIAIGNGDTEGVVLTGLASPSMDLFQNYVVKFGDVQTAVLAAAFSNPRYVSDLRFEAWCETYFTQMQSWSAFIERVRFRTQHERKNINRLHQKPTATPTRSRPQAKLRCNNCQKAISRQEDDSSESADGKTASLVSRPKPIKPLVAAGAGCPHCGKPFARCAICLLWQGTPRAGELASTPPSAEDKVQGALLGYCTRCRHGWHPHHGREWFAKHRECPVAGCDCYCRLLNESYIGATS